MLYITTRDQKDAFTAARPLAQNTASDGGLYVPFRLPEYTQDEIAALRKKTFGQAVAEVLNVFFSARLTGWDVDFAVGRNPVKLYAMNHRMVIAELWRNPGSAYNYTVQKLYNRLCQGVVAADVPTEWVKVAVRVAVLFAVFGELMRSGIAEVTNPVDLAVAADDFSVPMAAWYARKMGLPIAVIVCGCNADSGLWDLVRRGEYNPASQEQNINLSHEWLIQATLGCGEARRYQERCGLRRTYTVSEEALTVLNKGLYVAVVGDARIDAVMTSVYKTGGYRLSSSAAIAYGALQDQRASATEGRTALLLADEPALDD